ncbi:hypothetical protein GCM10028791_26170 [Echinicola sediminis]
MGTAQTIDNTEFYVSPKGNNAGDGSKEKPWKTLEYAKQKARSIKAKVIIYLHGGTYTLGAPLNLSHEDSNISFKAVENETPVISGGVKIANWRKGKDGIWYAKVPKGVVGRNLYIDGKRAVRARTRDGEGWYREANNVSNCGSVACKEENTPNTYKIPEDLPTLQYPEDVEMLNVMRWKLYRGSIQKIENGTAYMQPEYWELAKVGPFGVLDKPNADAVSWLENALEFLNEEREWFLDKYKSIVYYQPLQDEDMENAEVYLSHIEKLIDADGVENVTLQGLTFAHADWKQASSKKGYVSIQSGAYLTDPDYMSIEDAFEGIIDIPGNVHFKNARNVIIKDNQFVHLGGTALNFDTNNKYINVFGNTFRDISGSAITMGNLQDHHIVHDKVSEEIIVDNNLIEQVAVEYFDACAIKSSYVKNAVIVNNTINGASSGAISLGWGWGRFDVENFAFWQDGSDKGYNHPTIAGGVIVAHNKIMNITSLLGDTGAIYNLGASPHSKWYANYIENLASPKLKNTTKGVHGIYTDNGSRGIYIWENVVVECAEKPYLANGCHSYNTRGAAYYYEKGTGDFPAWVKEKAGVDKAVQHIRSREEIKAILPDTPVANHDANIIEKGYIVGKKIKAQGTAANYKASFATDGKTATYWKAEGRQGELVVDLGKTADVYSIIAAFGEIDQVTQREVYHRKGYVFEYLTSIDGKEWKSYGDGKKTSTIAVNQQYKEGFKPEAARYVKLKVHDIGDHASLGVLRLKVLDKVPVYGGTVVGPEK